MLSSETKIVTYVNKKGERSTYPLNSAMESANLEMVKRLKYTKDILTHMLNANALSTQRPGTNDPSPINPTSGAGLDGMGSSAQAQTVRP
jgi:polo-like kinase 1